MVRSRVRSFLSSFGGSSRKASPDRSNRASNPPSRFDTPSPDTPSPHDGSPSKADRRMSRPGSTVFSHNPPFMQLAEDTPAELQRIFSYLNSHTNKLFYEGYFLKLNDLDNNGRPCADRQWVECYAQLVGTVLSMWDATALDATGNADEVPPTFINLADASVKLIDSLPTQNQAGAQSLQNVLSVCSAGQNRYLLHFDSPDTLIQWAAAIRLAMYEHTCLYEAYTGSIIAAKGRELNGISAILERNRFKHEDWARVRFGAGTPWRRCWFVITPPDEKELQKARKTMKKKSAYDRAPRLVIGNIKFYETKKTKKVKPIATITDAYCAYAIYPQSKALIDQSTLIKIEGNFVLHSQSEAKNEGFVFVMPEVHPAVSGFEIMLRFLIPTLDTFNLYGRPTRLIAAVNHIKSIMFAFPDQERYDYIDLVDIANLMQTPESRNWNEAEWRKQLKDATARRMANTSSRTSSISATRPRFRASVPSRYSNVPTDPSRRKGPFPEYMPAFNQSVDAIVQQVPKEESYAQAQHSRSMSDTAGFAPKHLQNSAMEDSATSSAQDLTESPIVGTSPDRSSSEDDWKRYSEQQLPSAPLPTQQFAVRIPPSDVAPPPALTHNPRERPSTRPEPSPDARRANVRMSDATLAQLVAASGNMNFADRPTTSASHGSSDRVDHTSTPPLSSHGVSGAPQLGPAFASYTTQRTGPREQGPPVPEHSFGSVSPSSHRPNRMSTQSIRVDTEKAVKRKPISQIASPQSSVGEPSFDDLRHTVDEDALNLVGIVDRPAIFSPPPRPPIRQETGSVYEDDASTASPDYASTHGSLYSKNSVKSIPKRMGVMKTVGTEEPKNLVIGDAQYSLDTKPEVNPDIPSIDFGPTLNYLPTTGRPNTSDTLKKFEHHRTGSDATEKQRYSRHMDGNHSRSPSRDEYRRSVLWQPGMAVPRPVTPGNGLTPEQFVQQRSAASPPLHVHHRSPSTSTATPPPRPVSGDWMAHARSQSQMSLNRDNHPRPKSRGASSMINHTDIASHLSAREQEHVARMTGSSFFNLSSETKRTPPPVNPMGLVGAIDAREQEKRLMKEGMSNQMVQHAIAQRQHHWQHQPQPQLQQHQQFAPTTPPQSYGVQTGANSIYNMPTASRTWDALNQPYRPEEPRRQSWYNQLQPPQTAPSMHPTTQPSPQPGYFNTTHPSYY
ncbi:hypothetical protein BJX65DRAFT_9544 [Aspergillus insuetus]